MPTKKELLIDVFNDTQKFYQTNDTLDKAVQHGRQYTKLYEEDEYPELPEVKSARIAKAYVSKSKTFEAAMRLAKEYPDKKIAVLNFASAMRPGGGVKKGSSAQEESLCRCSTLFPTIDRKWLWKEYYDVNRAAKNVVHSDACIYSPHVIICKTDESIPQRMNNEDFVVVDVISCAAPNLMRVPANEHNPETGKPVRMNSLHLYDIHVKRAHHILHVAADNKVDILVLGAFGCGAFKNDPDTVAKAYKDAIVAYRDRFDIIEFAIYCKSGATENYEAFANLFPGSFEEAEIQIGRAITEANSRANSAIAGAYETKNEKWKPKQELKSKDFYKGFKYYSRDLDDHHHLYKYNEQTKEFYWMDHCWTGKGEWVLRDEYPAFDIVEISEERAQKISKGTLYTARHFDK